VALPRRLLLVDDSPEIARVVQLLARRAGQEVVCCADVPAAWESLRGGPHPDLVLLDVNLPGASGLDLFRGLRREEGLSSVLVALFVQWSVPTAIAEGLDEDIDFVLPKDLLTQPESWKTRVEEVLDLAAHPPVFPADRLAENPSSVPPPRSGEGEQNLSSSPSPSRGGGGGEGLAGVQQALRHPSLRKLGDEVVRALLRRSLRRALGSDFLGADDIDVWGSAAKLTQTLAPLSASRPTFTADLVLALSYQAACLLGRTASEVLRNAMEGLARPS